VEGISRSLCHYSKYNIMFSVITINFEDRMRNKEFLTYNIPQLLSTFERLGISKECDYLSKLQVRRSSPCLTVRRVMMQALAYSQPSLIRVENSFM
jgi:hypothetical protein